MESSSLTSIALIQYAANCGVNEAQVLLAVLYERGWSVEQDDKKAAAWFLKAADGGSTFAMHQYALEKQQLVVAFH